MIIQPSHALEISSAHRFFSAPLSRSSPERLIPDRVRQVAEEFESVFVAQMFQIMFQGIPTDGLARGGNSERVFRGMMITEIAKQTVHHQSMGIADAVEEHLHSRLASESLAEGFDAHEPLKAIKSYELTQLLPYKMQEALTFKAKV